MNINELDIKHMASMARSGETFVLKVMAAHPDILVSHNLALKDDANTATLFRSLKKREKLSISISELRGFNIDAEGKRKLLVKQGVWKHPHYFDGFILVRNPLSIYCSLKTYDADETWYDKDNNFWKSTQNRLVRWLSAMKADLVDALLELSPVEQFCLYYNYRVNDLLTNNLPLFRYEDLVSSSEVEFKKMCEVLGVDYYPEILDAHKKYEAGAMAHGKNDMSRAIDPSSINKCSGILTQLEFDTLLEKTDDLQKRLNYQISGNPQKVFISW
jgi:hypothetical protein